VARVTKSIEVDEPVDTIHELWLQFEDATRSAVHALEANIRWRGEVLTFEPKGSRTRVTLRIDYDPVEGDPLSHHVERTLESFRLFVEARSAGAAAWPAVVAGEGGCKS